MPGITGMGTTFNLPNYVGELFSVSPEDTPFLSAIGGLTGGRPTNTTHFTWSGYDLRNASATRQRREGADAPEAEGRTRFSVMNVLEIHQETVATSYSKMYANGQFGNIGAENPNVQGLDGASAVTDEHQWQIEQALTQMATDIEASFILGEYNDPSADSGAQGPRRTRGVLEAIQTNVLDADEAMLNRRLINQLMRTVWSNGGIRRAQTATVMANGIQRQALSEVFTHQSGYQEQTRDVGGVSVDTIITDFGRINVMLNRYVPDDEIVLVSLEQCAPRFANIPGKGFLFQEQLAKTGASEQTQLYGEIGLEYGNERAHGRITGLSTDIDGNGTGAFAQSVFITGTDSSLPVTVTGQPIQVENVDAGAAAASTMSVSTEEQEQEVPRPATNANRADWEAYILATYSIDTDEAKNMTRAQLQKLDEDLSGDDE